LAEYFDECEWNGWMNGSNDRFKKQHHFEYPISLFVEHSVSTMPEIDEHV
jgi:hypothetical protein